MVEEVAHGPLEAALARARKDLASFYLPPTLRSVDGGVEGGSVERVGIDALVERLRPEDDHGPRTTSFVAGAPGGGKTTLTRRIEARLLALGCPCVLVFGSHRFNILVTSRDDVEDEGSSLRTPLRYVLDLFSTEETEAYLRHFELDPAQSMDAIRAAGLESTASTPSCSPSWWGSFATRPGRSCPAPAPACSSAPSPRPAAASAPPRSSPGSRGSTSARRSPPPPS